MPLKYFSISLYIAKFNINKHEHERYCDSFNFTTFHTGVNNRRFTILNHIIFMKHHKIA